MFSALTKQSSRIRNSWLRFASLHSLANYYLPLIAALDSTKAQGDAMNRDELKSMPKEQVLTFIRDRLAFGSSVASSIRHVDHEAFKREHKRFEMSGYESRTGECMLHNLDVLNSFADLGIYDYTEYLFLDFYKGCGTLYLKYFGGHENLEFQLSGSGTVDFIYEIFKATIFSSRATRRRS